MKLKTKRWRELYERETDLFKSMDCSIKCSRKSLKKKSRSGVKSLLCQCVRRRAQQEGFFQYRSGSGRILKKKSGRFRSGRNVEIFDWLFLVTLFTVGISWNMLGIPQISGKTQHFRLPNTQWYSKLDQVGSGIGNILDNCSENSQIFIVGPYTYTVVYFWYVDHNSGILTIFLVRYGDHISGMVTRPYFLYVDHTSGILTIFLVC